MTVNKNATSESVSGFEIDQIFHAISQYVRF